MIKALFKLAIVCFVGLITVGGTSSLLNVDSDWGRYTIHSTVGPGSTLSVTHPAEVVQLTDEVGPPSTAIEQSVDMQVGTLFPVSTEQTVDVGSYGTLTGSFVVAMLTGYGLRGRRKTFIREG